MEIKFSISYPVTACAEYSCIEYFYMEIAPPTADHMFSRPMRFHTWQIFLPRYVFPTYDLDLNTLHCCHCQQSCQRMQINGKYLPIHGAEVLAAEWKCIASGNCKEMNRTVTSSLAMRIWRIAGDKLTINECCLNKKKNIHTSPHRTLGLPENHCHYFHSYTRKDKNVQKCKAKVASLFHTCSEIGSHAVEANSGSHFGNRTKCKWNK